MAENLNPYQKIIDLLKSNKVAYSEFEHEPVYTSKEAAKVRGVSASRGVKSLLLKAKTSFVLAILSGDKKLDSKKFKKLPTIKDFRFATPEEVKEIMGCEIGACYPFGSIAKLPMYADKSLDESGEIYFNPGVHTKTIKMNWEDLKLIEKPFIQELVQE